MRRLVLNKVSRPCLNIVIPRRMIQLTHMAMLNSRQYKLRQAPLPSSRCSRQHSRNQHADCARNRDHTAQLGRPAVSAISPHVNTSPEPQCRMSRIVGIGVVSREVIAAVGDHAQSLEVGVVDEIFEI